MTGTLKVFDPLAEIGSPKAKVEEIDKMLDEQGRKIKAHQEIDEHSRAIRKALMIVCGSDIRNGMYDLIDRTNHHSSSLGCRPVYVQVQYANAEFHRHILTFPRYDQETLDACAEGFETTYGITPEAYDSDFDGAPLRMMQIVDYRGDLYHHPDYTKSEHHRLEIREMKVMCNVIMELFTEVIHKI
jgi:hypothetical protein